MLLEREYMRSRDRARFPSIKIPAANRFSSSSPTQWANALIFALTAILTSFLLLRLFR